MARKTFKFRLYPNHLQRDNLTATLEVCRELYRNLRPHHTYL